MVKPNKTSDTIFTRGKWSFRNKTISQFTRDTESNLYIFFSDICANIHHIMIGFMGNLAGIV